MFTYSFKTKSISNSKIDTRCYNAATSEIPICVDLNRRVLTNDNAEGCVAIDIEFHLANQMFMHIITCSKLYNDPIT